MHKLRPLTIAAVWLATVAGASTLTWAVISAAGTQVGQDSTLTAGSEITSAARTASQLPTADTDPDSTPPSAATTGKPTSTKKATSATGAASNPTSITASWSGTGGKVTAKCTGNAVSLVSAVPDLGYRVDRDDDGDAYKIKVEFEPTNKDGQDISLQVTCQNQRPVFTREK